MSQHFDVAIIGGGPAGSTCGTLLRKYNPNLNVVILERAKFPRDHVGESQLPYVGTVLHEMGCWDKVEACNFPIKVGATYRWGQSEELWDFEFILNGVLRPEPRPAKFEGQRKETAFQVDRAIYDQVLLEHARTMGVDVREQTGVREVLKTGDRVDGLLMDSGETIVANHYVDCSGHSGILRRAMGVEANSPTTLQNIAIWDYYQNADWAVEIGVGGTRVQVMSQGNGWLWFIPLGPTRTSIGLILPASYYKSTGKRPEELFEAAVFNDPVIAPLMKNAVSEGSLQTTKDWSFLAERLVGENWFLAGESAGFADPILAAGMSLAHAGARDAAYTILALERRDYEPEWLRYRYDETHRRLIGQHIQFADYWYTHNGVFTDLQEVTKELAKDAGLQLDPKTAWRWFGTGGFIDHNNLGTRYGGYSLIATKAISANFVGGKPHYEIVGKTHFVANREGAEKVWGASLANGKIDRHRCLARNGKILPTLGLCGWFLLTLKEPKSYLELTDLATQYFRDMRFAPDYMPKFKRDWYEMLEAMVSDGWIDAETRPGEVCVPDPGFEVDTFIHENRDQPAREAMVG